MIMNDIINEYSILATCLKIAAFTGCLTWIIASIACIIYAIRCIYRSIIDMRTANQFKNFGGTIYERLDQINIRTEYMNKDIKTIKKTIMQDEYNIRP